MRSAMCGWLAVTVLAVAACGSNKEGSTCASGASCPDGGTADAVADAAVEASPPPPVNACASNPEGPAGPCNDLPLEGPTFPTSELPYSSWPPMDGGDIVPGTYVLVSASSTAGGQSVGRMTLMISPGCMQAVGVSTAPSSYTWTSGPDAQSGSPGNLQLTQTCPSPVPAIDLLYAATPTTLTLETPANLPLLVLQFQKQ